MTLSWNFYVDWDNNDSFDDGDEKTYLRRLNIKRGRRQYINFDGSGYERVQMGEMLAELDNSTGRFNPWDSGGDLYPNVRPGRKCRVAVDGTNLFTGYIQDIRPIAGRDERIQIRAVDGILKLQNTTITDQLRTSQEVDALFGFILTAISWGDGSNIDTDDDVVPYWWPVQGKSAWDQLNDLAQAWMGTCFINADGEFNFYARQHSAAASATVTQSELLKDIALNQPWETIRNYITVFAKPRRDYGEQEIYRLVDTPLVEAGETLELFADYYYDNAPVPADNVISPASTTDYTFNAQADGGGADLTADLSVTLTDYGTWAKLECENTGGTDGYITLLKIRGDALGETRTRIVREDSTSQSSYGVQKLTMDYNWLQSVDNAEDFADFLKAVLPDPNVFPVVHLESQPSYQFACDLFDKVALTIAAKDIDANFDVGWIEHQTLNETCQAVRTTWYLEPALDDEYWIFPAVVGVSTVLGF